MRRLTSIWDVVQRKLCISCGACVSAARLGAMAMVLDEKQGIFLPRILDANCVIGSGSEFHVCPGKGLPIKELAARLYPRAKHDSIELGRYAYAVAAFASDGRIRRCAASGGVMTAIANYLIEQGYVRGVTASRFIYTPAGPRTEAFVATSIDDLIEAQGSKYCPTTTNTLIRECAQAGGAYLFSGTPCQVAALRLAASEDPQLNEVFPYTMANFCGGYRDFHHVDDLIRFDRVDPGQVVYFRFRGGGQPGSMLFRSVGGQETSIPYPGYLSRSTVPKQKRCVYCIDATGELADFACGDAWIERFQSQTMPWSIVLARSEEAKAVIGKMSDQNLIRTEKITSQEIISSQFKNIESKKYRQGKRRRLSAVLSIAIPAWDVEFNRNYSSYRHELRILVGKTRLGRVLLAVKCWFRSLLCRN